MSRTLEQYFLEEWSAARGPLFDDPRAAVCRIYALGAVSALCDAAPERVLRVRASRILDEALAHVPDSNRPATKDQRARANMALVDIARLYRNCVTDMTEALFEILNKAGNVRRVEDQLQSRAWAHLLAAVLQGESVELQLRAARTLLARTRDSARRVGRPASPDSPEDEEYQSQTKAPAHPISPQAGEPPVSSQQPRYECSSTERGPP